MYNHLAEKKVCQDSLYDYSHKVCPRFITSLYSQGLSKCGDGSGSVEITGLHFQLQNGKWGVSGEIGEK